MNKINKLDKEIASLNKERLRLKIDRDHAYEQLKILILTYEFTPMELKPIFKLGKRRKDQGATGKSSAPKVTVDDFPYLA